MKAIRYFVLFLLLAASVGHILLFAQYPMTWNSAVILVFGIIYLAIGLSLYLRKKYSLPLGIIFPLIGLLCGMIAFDPMEAPLLLKILGIADATIIILCSILEWDRRKKAA